MDFDLRGWILEILWLGGENGKQAIGESKAFCNEKIRELWKTDAIRENFGDFATFNLPSKILERYGYHKKLG
jgi:hypothetical protein